MSVTRLGGDLAIDLGTANTCVFARGRGIVVSEPSIVALNANSGAVEAVGLGARDMLGRAPDSIRPVRPIRGGVIADFDAAEKMLAYFMRKAHRSIRSWAKPRVVIGVPTEITPVERRAVKDSLYRAKASEVHMVDEPMAAAVGAGLPVTEAAGNMIIDVGGGTTDVAVISLVGVVYSRSVRVAGDAMDDAIIQYVKRHHDLLIGERTAEDIKATIGSALPLDKPLTMEVKGRDLGRGVPKRIILTDSEVRDALAEPLKIILRAVREGLDQVPPELSADIFDRGISLCGGGSMLRSFDRLIHQETRLPVQLVEDPLSAVVVGAGRILSDDALLKKLSLDSEQSRNGWLGGARFS
jgi:rod shape-determining protein MreB and related proteins